MYYITGNAGRRGENGFVRIQRDENMCGIGGEPYTIQGAKAWPSAKSDDSTVTIGSGLVTNRLPSVICKDVTINTLQGWLYRKARVCYQDISDGSIRSFHFISLLMEMG
jgi:hypothetical protein